jgi:hypothetical protein
MSSTLSISKPISCFGLSDGAIDLTVQHAQTPQYNWNGGLGTVQNPINVKAGTYSVTITDTNGCFEIKQITVTEPPQIKATLLGDTAICAGRTAKLRFVVTGATNFTLVFSNGTTNTTVATTETIVAPTTTTNYNLVRIQSGTCVGVVEGTAKVQVTNLQTLTGFKAEKDTVCNGLELALSVTPSVVSDVQYIWQTPTGVFATQAPNLLIPNSRAINSGLYTVQVLSNGCSSEKTAPIRITIVNIATEQASAGNDTTECGGTTINLSAKAIQGQNVVGLWTALDGGTIASPSLRNSAVYNLKAGSNRFVWTLLDRFCGKLSPDTVSIFVASKPVLTDAEFRLEGTVSSILINLTELIKDTANVKVTDKIVSTINGSAKIQDKWFLSFDRSTALEAQRIEIPYEVCSTTCPTLCETSRLFINISALEEKVKFPSAIIFIPGTTEPSVRFPGIELIKNNECLIVDRWGVPVFGPAPYKNDSPNNAWDATKKGKPLPPGAYFYYITDKDKIPPAPFSGIIYLLEGQ